ncbi:MAG: hypothetical protein PHY40_01065 [Patescibacteria group bacterium]|nr:hypothetical protein [Patescibacteria group bacterium]
MAEKFKDTISPQERNKINLESIYNQLDYDPEINQLLNKFINEEADPHGEAIWPSSMVVLENGIFKIDGSEFDRMVEEAKQTAQEDDDSERILKIEKISRQKQNVISKIQDKLKQLGCDRVEII